MSDHPETRTSRTSAREIKFLLDDEAARAVRDWARAHLLPDVHGGGPERDEYTTATLYFDTPAFDVFHRRGPFGRSKYRVRRYGTSDVVFFERKLRTADRLAKRRTAAGLGELARLGDAGVDETWPIRWFHQRLRARGLGPICRVSYHRTARVGVTAHGPMRLTLDDHLVAEATGDLAFGGGGGTPIVPGHTLLELKYRGGLPALFEQLIAEFGLAPQAISKYRLAITALGLVTEARTDASRRG